MAKICEICGTANEDSCKFCMKCGNSMGDAQVNYPVADVQQTVQAPVQPVSNPVQNANMGGQAPADSPAPKKKNTKVIIIAVIVAVVIAAAAAVAFFVLTGIGNTENEKDTAAVEQETDETKSEEASEEIKTSADDEEYDGISVADIEKKFNEAPEKYKICDIRSMYFEGSYEETVKLAKEFESKITDEASFIELVRKYYNESNPEEYVDDDASLVTNLKYTLVKGNFPEEFATWLYSDDRETGDTTTFTDDDRTYVIYVVTPAHLNEDCLVDARHILVAYEIINSELQADGIDVENTEECTKTASDGTVISNAGTGYSIDVVLEAYEKACKIFEKYNQNPTEKNFASLAEFYSNDMGSVGDSGSSSGGLYENIEKGTYITNFENWVYDENRQPGDTGIIQSEYGYHIMYFVGQHAIPAWKEDVIADIKAEE